MLVMSSSFPVFNHGRPRCSVERNTKKVTTIKAGADPKLRQHNTAIPGGCMGRRRAAFFTVAPALLLVLACSDDSSDHRGDAASSAGNTAPSGGAGNPVGGAGAPAPSANA